MRDDFKAKAIVNKLLRENSDIVDGFTFYSTKYYSQDIYLKVRFNKQFLYISAPFVTEEIDVFKFVYESIDYTKRRFREAKNNPIVLNHFVSEQLKTKACFDNRRRVDSALTTYMTDKVIERYKSVKCFIKYFEDIDTSFLLTIEHSRIPNGAVDVNTNYINAKKVFKDREGSNFDYLPRKLSFFDSLSGYLNNILK